MRPGQIFYLDIWLSGLAALGISIHRTASLIGDTDFWEIRLNALLLLLLFPMEEEGLCSSFYYYLI